VGGGSAAAGEVFEAWSVESAAEVVEGGESVEQAGVKDVGDGVGGAGYLLASDRAAPLVKAQRAVGLPGSALLGAAANENGALAPPTTADTTLLALLLMADSWDGATGFAVPNRFNRVARHRSRPVPAKARANARRFTVALPKCLTYR
jgi:hypothetical protein